MEAVDEASVNPDKAGVNSWRQVKAWCKFE